MTTGPDSPYANANTPPPYARPRDRRLTRSRDAKSALPRALLLVVILGALAGPGSVLGRSVPPPESTRSTEGASFVHKATPINGAPAPRLDGRLDDEVWKHAIPIDTFTQRDPDEGEPCTERTEAWIVYDDVALYVGIRAYDSEPSRIVGYLTRRDEWSESDWLTVSIDSFGDRRTAFEFEVNPAGVERDTYRFDDTWDDTSWDAVWDVATQIHDDGWSAEFRIPFSQLRFSKECDKPWGLQIMRSIVRKNEVALWKPIAKGNDRWVSEYGALSGLEQIRPPRRLEVLPYTVSGTRVYPKEEGDPFADGREYLGRFGVDVKYGLTSDMTLDATVNPDFGQVEADPSVINLSAYETFFPEKRPFFLEGTDKFQYTLNLGDGSGETLFYTRRIGRSPQGDADGDYVDSPANTTILGATKISGKTSGGWTLGFVDAVTQEELARFQDEDGTKGETVVEPLTNYAVGRISRDLREGDTVIGGMATATNRRLDGTGIDFLHSAAYTGGLDVRHRINQAGWAVNGKLALSHVRGDPEAIEDTQKSSRRYFQRPDAKHVELDPTRTHLTGSFAYLEAGKFAGTWRGAILSQVRSPGFEANDLGFQRRADDINNVLWIGHPTFEPGKIFRQRSVNLNLWYRTNFGGEKVSLGGNVNGWAEFNNYWDIWGGVAHETEALHLTGLRGGPAMISDPSINGWAGFSSDRRKRVSFEVDAWTWQQPRASTESSGGEFELWYRVAPNLNLSFEQSYDRLKDDWQYIDEEEALGEPQYLMARIDQETIALTTRVDWTFRPNLSLQVYASPFISAGKYQSFRRVTAPRAEKYRDRFDYFGEVGEGRLTYEDGTYSVDLNEDGEVDLEFDDPDFNFRQFRSSIVLRWEYLAGSTIFLVYQHDRTSDGSSGVSRPWHDLGELWDTEGNHAFMVKINYWWNL